MIARLGITTAALIALAPSFALAQPLPLSPNQASPPPPAQQKAPRPAPVAKKSPPAAPKAPQNAAQPSPGATPGQMAVVYSPWVKFCSKGTRETDNKDVCLTLKEARLANGQLAASALLVERAGEEKKTLRATLPLGVQLAPGTRMFIDNDIPQSGEYQLCLASGCSVDLDVSADFVARLKKGQFLQLQGINMPGQVVSYPLPLTDFAKVNEGPPSDPAAFEAEQKQQWQERFRNSAGQKK